MAVVTMIEAELVKVALPGVCAHPFQPWQLLPDLHQHLGFWSVERGAAVESSWGRAPSNSMVRASLVGNSIPKPIVSLLMVVLFVVLVHKS